MSHFPKEKQKLAAAMLLSGFKTGEIAQKLMVRRETVSRWRANPAFQAYVEDLRGQCRESLRQRIFFLVEDTVAALNNALRQEFRPDKQARIAVDILRLLNNTNIMSHAAADSVTITGPRATPALDQHLIVPELPSLNEKFSPPQPKIAPNVRDNVTTLSPQEI